MFLFISKIANLVFANLFNTNLISLGISEKIKLSFEFNNEQEYFVEINGECDLIHIAMPGVGCQHNINLLSNSCGESINPQQEYSCFN